MIKSDSTNYISLSLYYQFLYLGQQLKITLRSPPLHALWPLH